MDAAKFTTGSAFAPMAEHAAPNRKWPAIDLISRKKILLIGARCFANSGKKTPIKIPKTNATKIHEVREIFFTNRIEVYRSPHFNFSLSTSKKSILGGRIKLMV